MVGKFDDDVKNDCDDGDIGAAGGDTGTERATRGRQKLIDVCEE
jgi:hypothetical protein